MTKYILLFASLSVVPLLEAETKFRRAIPSKYVQPISSQYIVVLEPSFRPRVQSVATSLTERFGGRLLTTYDSVLGGFLIELPEPIAERLSQDSRVRFVEQNYRAQLIETDVLSASRSVPDAGLWHLDRIDQKNYDGAGQLDKMHYYCETGWGVTAYVFDMPIRRHHPEFAAGQVVDGVDFLEGTVPAPNPSVSSCWHGTAVASVLAGQTVGVAPDTRIVPVGTMTCNGYTDVASLISAINWLVSPNPTVHPNGRVVPVNPHRGTRPSVVNMSWGLESGHNPGTRSVEYAINDVIEQGLTVVAAANNYYQDACLRVPANMGRGNLTEDVPATAPDGRPTHVPRRVIVAGGSMNGNGTGSFGADFRWQDYENGTRATARDRQSSWGPCVSIWAPAAAIRVADLTYDYLSRSGTSFAAPIVSGAAARYLQTRLNDSANWSHVMADDVWTWLSGRATEPPAAVVRDVGEDGPTKMLFVPGYATCRRRGV